MKTIVITKEMHQEACDIVQRLFEALSAKKVSHPALISYSVKRFIEGLEESGFDLKTASINEHIVPMDDPQ